MSRLLVQFSHLFKSFETHHLFEDIALSIHQGEIFALVGENGAGKTTLLKLLSGGLLPDKGTITQSPNLRIELLPQEIIIQNPTTIVRNYIEENVLTQLEKKMTTCLEDPNRLIEWNTLHEKYEQLGGYKRLPLEKVLKGLKLDVNILDFLIKSLSSGQKIRVYLAKILIQNPDLLLLDEPTNHLDIEMLQWLENILKVRKGATIIVSHDRKFINATCNRLLEINKGKLTCYGGNYDFYLKQRRSLIEKQIRAYQAQKEERNLLKQKIKSMTFSKRKPPPPSDRNIMAYHYRGDNHQKSMRHQLDILKGRLAEIETHLLEHPKPKKITGLKFSKTPLVSIVAIELEEVSKAFGNNVLFSHLSKSLCKGDRIILTGPNGVGKTTLLNCIMGALPMDQGKIRIAPTAKISYLTQEVEGFPMNQTPLKYFESRFPLTEEVLKRELHKAAIGEAELLYRPFSSLSIGQRKRLMLLSLILEKPNVLLLDEPTNHLDFLTLEALETALLEFEGAILAVSHDMTFKEKIATSEWKL